MKIIQTFWTKPALKSVTSRADRVSGGWTESKTYLMSLALSCYQIKKYYDEVELVTDRIGKEILIDILKLPYSKVRVELDRLNKFSPDLWALGKVYSYSIQTKPFIHIDGDVFIFDKFSTEIESAQLVCQNFDVNQISYQVALKKIKSLNFFIPGEILADFNSKDIISCNGGILGGTESRFLRKYGLKALEFVSRNSDIINHQNFPGFNIVFEQYLFYCMARANGLSIVPLIKAADFGDAPHHLVRFNCVPASVKYIHVVAGFKKNSVLAEKTSMLLRINHPDCFYRIRNALDKLKV